MDGDLKLQSEAVAAACRRFQAVVLSGQLKTPAQTAESTDAPAPPAPSPASHCSVDALTALLLEQQELLSRLSACGLDNSAAGPTTGAVTAPPGLAGAAPAPADGTAGVKTTGAAAAGAGNATHRGALPAVDEATAELAAAAAKRERVLGAGLHALGALASSLRGVLDDVSDLAPDDNQYTPSVQELLEYGHRLRYTTFATTGLYAGEPAPQQLHLDHAALWERALAERHAAMAAAAAPPPAEPADPATEAACASLLENLVAAGWSPEQGFPEPVVAFLSDMPGAMDVLRRLVEARFFPAAAAAAATAATAGAAGAAAAAGGAAGAGAAAPPAPAGPAAAAVPAPAAPVAPAAPAAAAAAANPASRLVHQLMLDEDSDDDGSGSEYTTTEDGSD